MRTFLSALMMAGLIALGAPVAAQQTTGNITGRIVDDQGAAVPGRRDPSGQRCRRPWEFSSGNESARAARG